MKLCICTCRSGRQSIANGSAGSFFSSMFCLAKPCYVFDHHVSLRLRVSGGRSDWASHCSRRPAHSACRSAAGTANGQEILPRCHCQVCEFLRLFVSECVCFGGRATFTTVVFSSPTHRNGVIGRLDCGSAYERSSGVNDSSFFFTVVFAVTCVSI